jgi:hypothetical protein
MSSPGGDLGGSGGSETVTGRWEDPAGDDYSPAIIFQDGRAYVSMKCASDTEILNDTFGVSGVTGGFAYEATSTSVTLTSDQGPVTYSRSGNTIYFGEYALQKVD